jgi:hypothetical protein
MSQGAGIVINWENERENNFIFKESMLMKEWRTTTVIRNNKHSIKIPEYLNNQKVLVTVKITESQKKKNVTKKPKYDFSDLVKKWDWEGDALAEQRKLRNEWEN